MSTPLKMTGVSGWLISARKPGGGTARQGLRGLLLLRAFVTIVSGGGLLLFQMFSTLTIPLSFIVGLVGAVVLSILLGYWRLRASWVVSDAELFCHLLVDVVFLFVLLLNTGGVTNPLISYLLVLLAVAATLLPRMFVITFAVGSIVIYTFFLIVDLRSEQGMGVGGSMFQLHLVGMWVIFLVSAVLIAVFIGRMASAIHDRELNLAKARENELRNEQLVAIGTLAAGTAHALGTPLSTMAVLLAELDQMDEKRLRDSDIKGDISILRQQIIRCKDSLSRLTRYYRNKTPSEQPARVALSAFASAIQDYIFNIHPTASVSFHFDCPRNARLSPDLSVRHAVINLIENGIKAAKTRVEVRFEIAGEDKAQVHIRINDDGPGIPPEVMENMGEPFISVRRESMGLGIFLANAAIQRLGGAIEMFNLKTGGALTLIKLPLAGYGED